MEEKLKYSRGRPKADGTKTVKEMRYRLAIRVKAHEAALVKAREKAEYFVLVTNVPAEGS